MKNKLFKSLLLTFIFVGIKSFGAFEQPKLLFEENKGQVKDMNGVALNSVLFRANLPGAAIWITENGIIYNFYKLDKKENSAGEHTKKNLVENIEWYRNVMNLKNASISKTNLKTFGQTDFSYTYLTQNASTNADLFTELVFSNIYEGIDWRLYIENDHIKQEFIVHANADIDLIDLEYKTSTDITIKDTKISFSNPVGIFTEGDLYCYQNEKSNSVKARYTANKQTKKIDGTSIYTYNVKIKAANFDHTKTLVIDPVLDWSTFYGGSNDEDGHAIYNDGTNTWVSGHTISVNFPTNNPGAPTYYQGSNAGGFGDCFILKFNNIGNLIWATYFGGTASDEATAIYSDGTNVWVAGYTGSVDFPLLNPGGGAYFAGTNAGTADCFISKFNVAGTLLWSTYFGGVTNDNISAIHVNNNNLFVGGTSDSPNFPVLNSGTYFQNYNAGNDGFILKFGPTNNLIWSTFLAGSGNDLITSIQTNSNSLFIGGYSNSTDFPTLNAGTFYQASVAGTYDGFISRFTLNGAMSWSTYFGGNNTDRIHGLTLSNSALWLTGTSSSTNMPLFNPGGSSFNQVVNNGFSDGFISKFNFNGTLQSSTYYGGASTDFLTSIATDGKNVFVGGYTNSTNIFTQNPGLGGYYQNTNAGFYDAILLKFDTASACKWASYYGHASNDYISAMACNGSKIFTTGYTQSFFLPTLNTGFGAYYQNGTGGSLDAFITTFKNCTNPTLTITTSPPCIGSALNFSVNGYSGATYQWFGPAGFNSSLQNPGITNVNGSNAGNYSLIVNIPNGCNNSDFINISLNPAPTVSVTGTASLCAGGTINLYGSLAQQYYWQGPNSFTSNVQTPVISNASQLHQGYYLLTVYDSNNCQKTDSVFVMVSICTGLDNQADNKQQVYAFPNPAKNTLYFEGINSASENYIITILNSEGKKIRSEKINKQVDISYLPNGIYLLTLSRDNEILSTQKIIKTD